MTKYGTLKKYQPYIDVIMADLGLTGKITLNVKFGHYTTMSGDAEYNNAFKHGTIRVESHDTHIQILETLMHELRHIWQEFTGVSSGPYLKKVTGKRGKIDFKWFQKWKDVEYDSYNHAVQRNHKEHKLYMASPWEKDARRYEKKVNTLFPNGDLPATEKRILVRTVGGVKFYKIAS